MTEKWTNVRRSEVGVAVLAAVLLALVMHWPLPLHIGRDVPRDLGDPLPQAWQVAWDGHALAHQPLHFFQANVFWPLKNSLAFSDALVGYAPFGLLGSGPHAAVVRYDLLFLFAYALAFLGAYLLARELGAGRAGGFVAGAAYAYAPWRLEQDGHLHVLSSGGIPLALFLLVRGYRLQRWRMVLCGWLVAAWQLSLGFSLGLQLAYLLLVLGLGFAGWALRTRWRPARSVLAATAGGALAFGLVAVLLAGPYLEVSRDHPEAKRTSTTVAAFSGWPRMYLAPPGANTVWSGATVEQRRRLTFVPEQTLFPGLVVVVLGLLCVAFGVFSRRLRWALLAGVLACAWLALGFHAGSIPWPYEFAYQHLPGWDSSRTPSRLNTLTSLGLALLAAGGAAWLAGRVRRGRVVLAAALVAAVLAEGAGFSLEGGLAGPAHPTVPVEPAGQRGLAAPQLHLPMSREGNRRYALWSTAGFPRLVNGRASFQPALTTAIAADVAGFPDARSVARLRSLGVRTVVLHPQLARGTSWEGAERKSLAGLGLTRSRRGDVIVFRVR
ncbi:MAG: hypothetical protein QOC77_2634 [Thermoleophilaceae bacterium]|jgi:hypothetical protein|nr:hypothetical protein [Thermoleophilaceae bacterium]